MKPFHFQFDYYLTINGESKDVKAFAVLTPGTPEVKTLPNGDPGYPDEEDEVAITHLQLLEPGSEKIPFSEFIKHYSISEKDLKFLENEAFFQGIFDYEDYLLDEGQEI